MTLQREPSTASLRERIDLSASGPRASTAAAGVSEAALFDAYACPSPVMLSRPCACGGDISARMGDWEWIVLALQAHQETASHRLWRRVEGL